MLFVVCPIDGRERYRPRAHDTDDPVVFCPTVRSWTPSNTMGRVDFHDGDRVIVIARERCDPAALAGLDAWLDKAAAEGTRVSVRDIPRPPATLHDRSRSDRGRPTRSQDRRVPLHVGRR